MNTYYHLQKRKGFFNFNATSLLIIINIIVFFAFLFARIFYPILDKYVALTPELIIHGKYLWTLITSMFVHAGFAHLFFNMISLFFIGGLVEKIIGKKRFIWFYLISGVFAGLFFAGLSGFFGIGIGEKIFGSPNIAGVGASGAIFGLLGILVILIPNKKVYLVAGPLFAIIIQSLFGTLFPGHAFSEMIQLALTIYVFVSIFTIFSFNPRTRKIAIPIAIPFWLVPVVAIVPLVLVGLFINLPIGNMAHFGGFIAGAIYGIYLKNKYKNKTRSLQKYFN